MAGMQRAMAFYELVKRCQDRDHALWPGTGEILQGRGLLESGTHQPHQIVRDVVLSAVTGTDPDYALGSPYTEEVPA